MDPPSSAHHRSYSWALSEELHHTGNYTTLFPYYSSHKDRKPILCIPAAPEPPMAFQHGTCWMLWAELLSICLPFIYPPMHTGQSWRTTEKSVQQSEQGRETEQTAVERETHHKERKVRRSEKRPPLKFGSANK